MKDGIIKWRDLMLPKTTTAALSHESKRRFKLTALISLRKYRG